MQDTVCVVPIVKELMWPLANFSLPVGLSLKIMSQLSLPDTGVEPHSLKLTSPLVPQASRLPGCQGRLPSLDHTGLELDVSACTYTGSGSNNYKWHTVSLSLFCSSSLILNSGDISNSFDTFEFMVMPFSPRKF